MRPTPARKAKLLFALASLFAAVSAAASAQTYPPQGSELAVSASAVAPGGTVSVQAAGFRPRSSVALSLRAAGASFSLGVVEADSRGAIAATVRIPASVPAGRALLLARGEDPSGRPLVVQAVLGIVASGGSTDASPAAGERTEAGSGVVATIRGGLPNTGFDAAVALLAGAGLVATGVALRRAGRNRES